MPKFQDLTGLKFGRLTVLNKDEEATKKHHRTYWNCLCECGKNKSIAALSLKNGSTQSCGCLRNEKVFEAVAKDETGHRYGKIAVLRMDTERSSDGKVKWICRCDCGNIKSISGADLRSGNTQSCGSCSGPSQGEQCIQNILDDNNINYAKEFKIAELGNKRFDFAIFENNQLIRLIEFDGEQHFKEAKWKREKLIRTKESDNIKNLYALKNNIPLVRIPYWELKNINFEMLFGEKFLIKGEK